MNSVSSRAAPIDVALAHATGLLNRDAALAAEQAGEILKVSPGHPVARLVLGAALRIQAQPLEALAVLEPLAAEQPHSAATHLELAIALCEAGRLAEAIEALRRSLKLRPDSADAWRLLGDYLDMAGDDAGADGARARFIRVATRDPRLTDAAAALVENDLPLADARLRAHLAAFPTDVAALRMLAEVAARLRRYAEAQELLEKCLQLAPGFDAARHNLAVVLNRQGRPADALPHVERLLSGDRRNPGYRNLKAAVLAHLGDYAGSIALYEEVLRDYPRQPKVWMSYGHALKTEGRREDAIVAYRRAIGMQPTLGEAWWSLANLKTFRFTPAEVRVMREALGRTDLGDEDRVHFEFALGKALEDAGSYAKSFAHYASGNALHRRRFPYSADENARFVAQCRRLFTARFFADRREGGCAAPDPIFIVGLPRAGSTLIEQILASHPQVEGTIELPDMPQIARELAAGEPAAGEPADGQAFFRAVAALDGERRRALGERYLATTRIQRRTQAPLFIDKMPNNFLYTGLIALVLPRAKIIDARRHPLGCCFSAFKQHFARGQGFSYDLADIGRYYRDYVELMAHFDGALPGRVHRVLYEAVIGDTEGEVRRLLDYCGLPFDERCLRYFENRRAVRTASSEQVRQPIFRDGLDQWRHYEPYLGPLREALGPMADDDNWKGG